VRAHNRLADSEAEAGAAIGASAGFVGAIETLKDVRQVFGRYPLSRVRDGQNGSTVFEGVLIRTSPFVLL